MSSLKAQFHLLVVINVDIIFFALVENGSNYAECFWAFQRNYAPFKPSWSQRNCEWFRVVLLVWLLFSLAKLSP